jgi:EmrB/QacA subfamily drug resistance transporter
MTSSAASAPRGSGELSHRQILTILSGLMLGMFLAALDQTIVATSIRTISDDLHGLSLQAWATTAYLITATISTPLYGKLSDLYGRRPFFLTAITVFVLGSALCGLANSMYQLAAFRAFQGLGAGGLFSLALTIIGDIVPPRERAKYQGYFLAVFGTSSVLGPVIGGFLAGQDNLLGLTGWRWVFLVNVPIGVAALAVVARNLHLPHRRREHQIDWPGAVALVIGLVPLLTIAEQGRDWGWASGRAVACYALGALGLALFLLAERHYGDDALLPLRLFRGRTFTIGSLLNFIIGMGMFGGLAALPLYLQIVKGVSPTRAGLLLVPLVAGIMVGSVISGQVISRTGRYKIFPIVGAALLVIGMLLFSRLGVDTPLWQVMLMAPVFGLGLGGNMQPLVLALQNAVPPQDMGVATSSATFFRQMGGTLGTAVFLSVLFSTVGDKIAQAFRAGASSSAFQAALRDPSVLRDPANAAVVRAIKQGSGLPAGALDDTSFLSHLDPRLARPFLIGFAQSIDLVFLCGMAVLAVAFVIVFFLPEEPLRQVSGIEARRQEAAAVTTGSSQMVDGEQVGEEEPVPPAKR